MNRILLISSISASEYSNDEKVKSIVDSLVDYIKTIDENDKLSEYKESYIHKRKLLNRHLYLMNKVNNWNTSVICPICISDKVDSYCNPCGHTACRKCLDKTSNIINLNLIIKRAIQEILDKKIISSV